MTSKPLHRQHATKALRALSNHSIKAGVMIELSLCHGALIALVHLSMHDGSSSVCPNVQAHELARKVGEVQRLRLGWLETDLAIYLAEEVRQHRMKGTEFQPGLTISVNSAARTLAEKLHILGAELPGGSTDLQEAEFLLEHIAVTSPQQIRHIYAKRYPHEPLSDLAEETINRAFRARAAG